jgi:serine/threonine protein kinase/pimeloyl-ACP methyl ester carboxylesterase
MAEAGGLNNPGLAATEQGSDPAGGQEANPGGGRLLAGRYRLGALLGRGGMGSVYEARQLDLQRTVAIKMLSADPGRRPEMLARFEREARLAASIGHENIIGVLDFGKSEAGEPFIVMERLHGVSLRELLDAAEPLPLGRLAQIVDRILAALGAAHDKGIVHRDIKPENVFVSPGEDGDRVKVLDFGISKVVLAGDEALSLTQTGALLGTPLYMSPEQARGVAEIDLRADLHAVGVILYRALSGRYPYEGPNFQALLAAILLTTPPPLAAVNPSIPAAWAKLVERAIVRDREARFQSAREFRQALRSLPPEALLGTTAHPAGPAGVPVVPVLSPLPVTGRSGEVLTTPDAPPRPPLLVGEMQYARSGKTSIAWQRYGNPEGIPVIAIPPLATAIELVWDWPPARHYFERWGAFGDVVHFDKRGCGASERFEGSPGVEERMDDIRAVMDSAGMERAALYALSEGGPIAMLFAATYPERVSALVLHGSFATLREKPGFEIGLPEEAAQALIDVVADTWGRPETVILPMFVPSQVGDAGFLSFLLRFQRMAASPATVRRLMELMIDMDVRHVAEAIRCPTLVLRATGDLVASEEHSRWLAAHIPGARLVQYESPDHYPALTGVDPHLDEIEAFLSGSARRGT